MRKKKGKRKEKEQPQKKCRRRGLKNDIVGDDREAGLGLGDQDCGESAVARQDTEKESFMAKERGDYRQDARMNNRSHNSGTPLSGGG